MAQVNSITSVNSTSDVAGSDQRGFTLIVNTANNAVSFNYMLYPDTNVLVTSNSNKIISKTVNVGTAEATQISANVYRVFIDTSLSQCADEDLAVKMRYLDSTGAFSEYSDAVVLYLTPAQVGLITPVVFREDDGYNYGEGVRVEVTFAEQTCYRDELTYNLALQFTGADDDSSVNYFRVYENLPYISSKGKIAVFVEASDYNGVQEDTVWCAVQAVRTVDGAVVAVGALSDTVAAADEGVPSTPVLVSADYTYQSGPESTDLPKVVLTWTQPPSPATPVTAHNLYRQVGDAPFALYQANLSAESLTYTDENLPTENGTAVKYAVTSVGDLESPKSNTLTINILLTSSAVRDLAITSVINDNAGAYGPYGDATLVKVLFQAPEIIRGDVAPDDRGNYSYDYYSGGKYGWVIALRSQLEGGPVVDLGTTVHAYENLPANGVYEFVFPDLTEVAEGSIITANVILRTHDPLAPNDELNGDIAETIGQAFSLPVITDINGTPGNSVLQETDLNLSSFNIYTFGPLTASSVGSGNPVTITAISSAGVYTTIDNFGGSFPVPTIETSGSEYEGAYKYEFSTPDGNPGAGKVLTITAGNKDGFTVLSATPL